MSIYIGGPIEVSDMQGPAPDGFHVPLNTEWQGLKTIMTSLSLTTGDSWKINLHMPFAGSRNYSTANIGGKSVYGYYWSSSPYGSALPTNARYLFLNSSTVGGSGYNDRRTNGYAVRCFKNSYVTPDSSWTVIQGTLGSAGIFWNQAGGLISITDGTTGYTIQDKNLGATTVYNNGDTLSQDNMGNMYQWGNNYGFPSTGTISNTSTTQVDASSYGPGNYYSSDTFITGSDDWSSVINDNLWGGVSQGSGTKSIEVQNIYIGDIGWQPGTNTVLYLPMSDDFDDKTGNNTMSNSGATITTLNGVKCGYFSSSTLTCSANSLATTNKTISVRLYPTQGSGWIIGANHSGQATGDYIMIYTSSPWVYQSVYGGSASDSQASSGVGTNGWRHLCVSGTKIYVDGVNVTSSEGNSGSYNQGYPYTIGRQNSGANTYAGYMSELIVESEVRDASKILSYYNATKNNYTTSSSSGVVDPGTAIK